MSDNLLEQTQHMVALGTTKADGASSKNHVWWSVAGALLAVLESGDKKAIAIAEAEYERRRNQ